MHLHEATVSGESVIVNLYGQHIVKKEHTFVTRPVFPSTAYATLEEFPSDPQSPVYDDPDFFLDCLGAGNDRAVDWTKGGAELPDEDFELDKSEIETGADYSFDQIEAYRER